MFFYSKNTFNLGQNLILNNFKIDIKMRKIVLFIAFLMCGLVAQAQNTQLERAQAKEMDLLEKIVTYEHKNLTFNENQTVRLERVFLNKSKELVDLRNKKDISKGEYANGYRKIQEKYKPLIEEILSPAQRIEYRKNINKRVKKLKD